MFIARNGEPIKSTYTLIQIWFMYQSHKQMSKSSLSRLALSHSSNMDGEN